MDVTDYKIEYKNKIINYTIPLEDAIFFCGHVNIKKYHSDLKNFVSESDTEIGVSNNITKPRVEKHSTIKRSVE